MPAPRIAMGSDDSDVEEGVIRAPSSGGGPSSSTGADQDVKVGELEDEQEEGVSGSLEEAEEDASPHGVKRPRIGDVDTPVSVGDNGAGPSTPSWQNAGRASRAQADTPGSQHGEHRPRTYLGERDAKGFVPGAIVRIACHNFMTYDDLEFTTGPRLNMVIAPNGTGKSSIVCAIALGLGFKPALLGRADHLKHFVRHGEETGWVEIEIKGRKGKPNPVIRRDMSVANNRSDWTLNGKKATQTKVEEIVRDLNIQVDNLCAFLPQEKVSSFAQMGPVDLLAETQKTAGHPKLNEWHLSLIGFGRSEATLKGQLTGLEDSKKTLDSQLAGMQRDVARFREREAIQNRIKALELALPFAKYGDVKARFERTREQAREAKQLVEDLERSNAPNQAEKDVFNILNNSLEQRRKDLSRQLGRIQNFANKRLEDAGKIGKEGDKLRDELDQINNDEAARRSDIATLKREIASLESQTADPVEEPNTDGYKAQITEKGQQVREKVQLAQTLQAQMRDRHSDLQDLKRKDDALIKKIQDLKSVGNVRLQQLQRFSPSVYDANRIVDELRRDGRLRGTVYPPVRLLITPSDPRYAAAIEYSLDSNILHTFLCTDEHDYDLILTECNDKARKGINAAVLPTGDNLQNYQPPVPAEELRQLGFDNYLINLVRGPEYVLTYLCARANLQRIPIAMDPNARIDEQRLHRPGQPIRAYIIGNTRVNVNFSSYGNKELILKSFQFRAPKVLAEAGVDVAAIRSLQTDIGTNEEEMTKIQSDIAELRSKEAAAREDHAPLEQEHKALKAEMQALTKRYIDFTKKMTTLGQRQRALENKLAEPTKETRAADIKDKLRQVCRKRLDALAAFQESVTKEHANNHHSVEVRLKLAQLQKDRHDFDEEMAESDAALEEARQEFRALDTERAAVRQQALDLLQNAKLDYDNAPQELKEGCEALKEGGQMPPAAQLEGELNNERARLDLTHDVGRQVLQRYTECESSLKRVEASLADHRDRLEELVRSMTGVKIKWQAKLQELVDSIDERFEKALGTLGILAAVKVAEDPNDFAKWGIQILVAFREGDALQPLTAHRQSGGERSLATIMYLMSLTELAKAPFTLVDEINQGMDQRTERMVHDHLVNLGCREDAAQSWLVTPKLLPNLRYHAEMRIHCVFNGHWIPEQFDARAWLAKCRQRRVKQEA